MADREGGHTAPQWQNSKKTHIVKKTIQVQTSNTRMTQKGGEREREGERDREKGEREEE